VLSRIAPILLLAALVVTGCSTPPAPAGDRPPAGAQPATGDELPRAADGTDTAACAHGNCEVEVHAPQRIKLTGQGDVVTLTIDRVGAAGVDFTTTSTDGGTSTGSIQGGCTLTFYSGGGGSTCGGSRPAYSPYN
jgi:PBP1b-binding outer membrane lipoprotein LpoB